jgi:hypothetical protein
MSGLSLLYYRLNNKYMKLSNCCNAEVKVAGATTKYYFCTKCLEPCDLADEVVEEKGWENRFDEKFGRVVQPVKIVVGTGSIDRTKIVEANKDLKQFFKEELKRITDEELLDQLQRLEGVLGKYNCQHGGTKCNFQTNCHRLIDKEKDIIKNLK